MAPQRRKSEEIEPCKSWNLGMSVCMLVSLLICGYNVEVVIHSCIAQTGVNEVLSRVATRDLALQMRQNDWSGVVNPFWPYIYTHTHTLLI